MGFLIKSIYFVLALMAIITTVSLFKKSREGYHNLSPGRFPIGVDVPILHEDYPLKQHMGLSTNTYEMNRVFSWS